MGASGLFLRGPCWEYHFRYWAGVAKKPSWSGCKQPAGQQAFQHSLTCTWTREGPHNLFRQFQTVHATRACKLRGVRSQCIRIIAMFSSLSKSETGTSQMNVIAYTHEVVPGAVVSPP